MAKTAHQSSGSNDKFDRTARCVSATLFLRAVERLAFKEPTLILSEGKPIRFVRNDIFGEPHSWYDMG